MWGTQFHPEKSGAVGLGILANFVGAVRRRRAVMELYPAIDIRDGGAVRLTQGDFDRQSEYGDPVALARRFAAGGAPWLHVVDLDAARLGRPANRPTVLAIAGAVDIPVQTGGGVRSEADVDELLDGGVARVVLGTVALDDPEPGRRAGRPLSRAGWPWGSTTGVDADGRTEVAVRGWEQGSGRTVAELLDDLDGAGVAAVIVTAIDRDGTLAGPGPRGLWSPCWPPPPSRSSPRAAWARWRHRRPGPASRAESGRIRRPRPVDWPGPSPARRWWTAG